MTSRCPSALDDFVNQLDALVRKYTDRGRIDGAAIVREAHPHLTDLIRDTGWLEERHRKPAVTGESAAYLLAAAPDDSWTVLSVVFPAGSSTPVHDHLTWGLVGVHQGVEEESCYERLDDGSRASFARLRYVDTTRNEPGSISYVVPPQEFPTLHAASSLRPKSRANPAGRGAQEAGKRSHRRCAQCRRSPVSTSSRPKAGRHP